MGLPPTPIIDQSGPLSTDKAYLLGVIAGDGSLQWDEGNGYKLNINCGLDKDHADRCAVLVTKVYGVPCSSLLGFKREKWKRKTNFYAHASSKLLLEDLLSLSTFGIYKWRVPQVVKDGPPEIRGAWLRGFADADGCMTFKPRRSQRQISLDSVNLAGLDEAAELLTSLDIEHSRASHDRKIEGHGVGHKIIVCYHADVKRFAELVGFTCIEKVAKLTAAIGSYQRLPKRTEDVEEHLDEVRRRRVSGESWNEIAVALGLSRENVRALCWRHKLEPKTPCRGKIDRMLPQIMELRANGLTSFEIACQLGLKSKNSVNAALQRARRREKHPSTPPGSPC